MKKITNPESQESSLPNGMRKGNYKKGEKPSQFAGAWEKREEGFKELRRKAWRNRGVH